jgi:fructokinase
MNKNQKTIALIGGGILFCGFLYRFFSKEEKKSFRLAGIEAGGTKFIVAIAEGDPRNIVSQAEFDTTTPDTTISLVINWLQGHQFDKLGIASFGPVDLNKDSDTYGFITTTPKPGWGHVDFVGRMKRAFPGIPIGLDTDVNGAVLAEKRYSEEKISSIAYVTVGTGIGVGIVSENQPVHGMLHPEMGHIYVNRKEGDSFEGTCPFHGFCLEGNVAAPNLAKRLNIPPSDLPNVPDDHEVWDIISFYLAQLCVSIIYTVSAQKIIFGGGVIKRKGLLENVRKYTEQLNNGYVQTQELKRLDKYITESKFGQLAGLIGALVIAENTH